MTCERVTALIAGYLAGELDPETVSAFEEHLKDCPDCVAFLRTYQSTMDAVRSLRCEEMPFETAQRVRRFFQLRIKAS